MTDAEILAIVEPILEDADTEQRTRILAYVTSRWKDTSVRLAVDSHGSVDLSTPPVAELASNAVRHATGFASALVDSFRAKR